MIEILSEEILKDGRIMTVKHSPTIAFSPAYTFFLRQVADLIDNGHGSKFTSWDDNSTGIIWGEIENKIVAIFAYHTEQVKYGVLNVMLTAVDKDHRGNGIHTLLNKHFEKTATKLGCSVTAATVHPNNSVRLKTAEKDGLKIGYLKLYKKLGD